MNREVDFSTSLLCTNNQQLKSDNFELCNYTETSQPLLIRTSPRTRPILGARLLLSSTKSPIANSSVSRKHKPICRKNTPTQMCRRTRGRRISSWSFTIRFTIPPASLMSIRKCFYLAFGIFYGVSESTMATFQRIGGTHLGR